MDIATAYLLPVTMDSGVSVDFFPFSSSFINLFFSPLCVCAVCLSLCGLLMPLLEEALSFVEADLFWKRRCRA